MFPAGTVSGSSVTSGRDCAQAGAPAPIRPARATTATTIFLTLTELSFPSGSEQAPAVEQNGDRSVVDEIDLHLRLEDAGLDRGAGAAQAAAEMVVTGL